MQRLNKGHGEPAAIQRAAVIARIDLGHTLPAQKAAKLRIGNNGRAARLGNRDRVADMIIMAMREQDVGDITGNILPALVPGSIPGQEGIDKNAGAAGFDLEGRMPIPRQFHVLSFEPATSWVKDSGVADCGKGAGMMPCRS